MKVFYKKNSTTVMGYSWELTIYTKWEEVDDPVFLEQWVKWYDMALSSQVFSHPVLVKTWTDCYRNFQDIVPLYCVAKTGETTVILPLVCWTRNWKSAFLKVVVPVGFSDYDYHDPLVIGEASPSLMCSFWTLIQQKVLDDGLIKYDMVDLNGMHIPGSQKSWEMDEACPFIDLDRYENFAEYTGRLGKSLRKDISRRKRMFNALGNLSFHAYGRQELDRALHVFPQFLDVHSAKWPNAFKAPGFHEALLRNGLPEGLVHFSEIRIDNDPVSWEIGFCDSKKAYSYMPAYREEYADFSLGKVHLALLIEDCFQNVLSVFDFMRGSEEYKSEWTDSQIFVHRYRQSGSSIQSRMKVMVDGTMREIVKRLHCFPVYIWSADLFKKQCLLLTNASCTYAESFEKFVEFMDYGFLI